MTLSTSSFFRAAHASDSIHRCLCQSYFSLSLSNVKPSGISAGASWSAGLEGRARLAVGFVDVMCIQPSTSKICTRLGREGFFWCAISGWRERGQLTVRRGPYCAARCVRNLTWPVRNHVKCFVVEPTERSALISMQISPVLIT